MEAQGRPQVRGSQDDSFVGYVFQRAQTDPDFPHYAANKQPARWALGDDTFIDVSLNLQTKLYFSACRLLYFPCCAQL
jgi:hypothetical protein